MRLKRRIFGVFAAALAGVLLCGCTAAEGMQEHRTETPITIKVGSDNYPPFNYTDENGNPAGVDVDLAKESFGRLGYAVSFVGIDWEEKKKLVEHGDIDCIWGCFSIDGRENEYNWTEQSTTKPESIFLERTDSRIPLVREVYSLEDRELLYTSLGKGYVDAIAAHETAIRQYMKDYDADYRILDESILTTGIGVAFAKNDTRGLSEQLSRVFEEMRADGTTRTIIGRYLSDPDKYLEVDCAAD